MDRTIQNLRRLKNTRRIFVQPLKVTPLQLKKIETLCHQAFIPSTTCMHGIARVLNSINVNIPYPINLLPCNSRLYLTNLREAAAFELQKAKVYDNKKEGAQTPGLYHILTSLDKILFEIFLIGAVPSLIAYIGAKLTTYQLGFNQEDANAYAGDTATLLAIMHVTATVNYLAVSFFNNL